MDRLTHTAIRAIAPIALAAAALLLSRCGGGNSPPPGPSETVSLSALSINPTSVVGGDGVDGSVTVTPAATGEGATVTLSTDNAAVVSVPANVRVAAGTTSATFRATTSAVNTETMVRITGSFGVTQSQVLTVMPRPQAMPSLASISLAASSVLGGDSVQGTVTITAPAPSGGVTVGLTSSDAGVATVPSTVTVGSGATTASFAVSTRAVAGAIPITITASAFGLTQSQVLTVMPPPSQPMPSLASISLASSSVLGGNSVQGTVTMTAPAPSGGVTVGLTSSDAGVATVPSTVTVGAGATTASFAVSTRAVGGAFAITISAAYGGRTQSTSLTVTPPPPVVPVLVANPNGPYDGYACSPMDKSTTCGTPGSFIIMTAKGSTSSPNPIAHWYWDCGQTGNPNCLKDEITPSFSYTRAGFNGTEITYIVTLIIEDTLGNRSAPATTKVLVRQRY